MDSEKENGEIETFAIERLDVHTLSEKLNTVFEKLNCAGNLNVAFGFLLKSEEDGTCRYYCALKNNPLMERSKIVGSK